MSDDKNNRGARDRSRVNLNQDYERRYWELTLDTSEHELRNAISAVGDSPAKVREYLKHRQQRKGPYRVGYLGRVKRPNGRA
jgi:hypothetical protein